MGQGTLCHPAAATQPVSLVPTHGKDRGYKGWFLLPPTHCSRMASPVPNIYLSSAAQWLWAPPAV